MFLLSGCIPEASVTQETPVAPQASGVLRGSVTVGPLCPDTQFPQKWCEASEETYRHWPIGVYRSDKKIAQLAPDGQGQYRLELPSGEYRLELELKMPPGLGGVDLPRAIRVESGRETTEDIRIETGIA